MIGKSGSSKRLAALEAEDRYGPQHALATFSASAGQVWGWLQRHERFRPSGKAAVAAMVEPVADGRFRPVLIEVKQGAQGAAEFGTILVWGAAIADRLAAADTAAEMHSAWYGSDQRLIWSSNYGDGSLVRPDYEWQEAVMFATWAEERAQQAGDTSPQTGVRRVEFDDSDELRPHFVLETEDAHGFKERVAAVGFEARDGFDGPTVYVSEELEMLNDRCVEAFKSHERMRRREGVRLSECVARSLDAAVELGSPTALWLAGGPGSAEEAAVAVGALGVHDDAGRRWLSEPERTPVCHQPRLVVSDCGNSRGLRVETLAGDGSMSFGRVLEGLGSVAHWRDLEPAEVEEALEATLAAGREAAEMGLEL